MFCVPANPLVVLIYVAGGGGWMPIKSILCVASLAAFLCINLPAFADITLPQDTNTDNHAYTLTKVDQQGENTITKYEWSEEHNKLVPVNYRVDLKKKQYGNSNGETTLIYGWEKNPDTNFLEFKKDPTNPVDQTITYTYNKADEQQKLDNRADNSDKTITGVFVGQTGTEEGGGAIFNNYLLPILGDINADFVGNYISSSSSDADGGAIYNQGIIRNITGDFIGNYASSSSSSKLDAALGGAIYNHRIREDITKGTIGDITGDFIGNYASSTITEAYGGAIYNANGAVIGNITGDFIGNYVSGSDPLALGGAIFNDCTMSGYNSLIGDITGDFIGNYAKIEGELATGGAIYNGTGAVIGNITGDFIGNYVSGVSAAGGAISNDGTIGKTDEDGNLIGGIYGSFINNYAKIESDSNLVLGGAVYTVRDMNFIADNQTNYFSGNYTEDSRGKTPNAIFVETSSSSTATQPTIKLIAQNNGQIIFNDQIDGGKPTALTTIPTTIDRTNQYNLALTGDKTGTIHLNNEVINANATSENVTLNLGKNNVFEQSNFTITSGSLGFINGIAEQQIMQSANINGNIKLAVDVDLAAEKMDTLPDNVAVSKDAQINVNHLNLISDANKDITNIQFAPDAYKSQVSYTGSNPVAYSPIWKYDVDYLKETGEFLFTRGASSTGNPSDNYNPAVLAPSVATQAGAYTTQLQTFNYAFQHSDNFMNIPYLERLSIKNQNKYALSPTADATDVGTFSPLLTKHYHNGFWFKPYASFENIPLKNGPKVSNINYGTLVGYDTEMKTLKHGIDRVLTAYIGYNGASQRYSGVDAYQNGGLIGTTATFYKGNFFNATTLSVGASAGSASNMFGSENYTMLMAGIGNKTGYNFEFLQGKAILQPSMLLSYTFVNTFDYTNSAGLRIKSDPLNAIQLAPGIKLIGNTKSGWQPYASVAMVWNLLDDTKVTANDTRLPEMSIKPYVQYGVGVQKCFKDDKMTAFGQAMVHNGGRNGISLTAGLRWRVGKE